MITRTVCIYMELAKSYYNVERHSNSHFLVQTIVTGSELTFSKFLSSFES